jgi:hypothetical protein
MEPHYTLRRAVEKFFPDGPVGVSSLRNAIRKGALQATKPEGKLLVTEIWIVEWLERCRVAVNLPACGSNPPNRTADAQPSGALLTDRNEKALNATNATLNRLSANSRTTSQASSSHL